MTKDLDYTRLSELKRAVEAGDPALGDGGTIVIPEPMWTDASAETQAAFKELAKQKGFSHRIERRWQRRPPEGHGITKVSVERNED